MTKRLSVITLPSAYARTLRAALFAVLLLAAYCLGTRFSEPVQAQNVPITTFTDLTGNGGVQALAANGSCSQVQLVTLRANTGTIRVGDANVGATRGIPLEPGSTNLWVLPYTMSYSAMYFYGPSGVTLSFTCMR